MEMTFSVRTVFSLACELNQSRSRPSTCAFFINASKWPYCIIINWRNALDTTEMVVHGKILN